MEADFNPLKVVGTCLEATARWRFAEALPRPAGQISLSGSFKGPQLRSPIAADFFHYWHHCSASPSIALIDFPTENVIMTDLAYKLHLPHLAVMSFRSQRRMLEGTADHPSYFHHL